MKVLPKGITGFFHVESEAPPSVSKSDFKSFCYQFTQLIGAKVESTTDDITNGSLTDLSSTRNYFAQLITHKAKCYWLLCNQHYPLIGLSTDHKLNCESQFIDLAMFDIPSEIPTHVRGEFVILTSAQLRQKPNMEMLCELEPVELKEIKYWGPSQIAQIIFNTWD